MAVPLHFSGGLAHRLNDQGDGPRHGIEVGEGEWDSLAVLMDDHDDELPRLRRLGQEGMAYVEAKGLVREILAGHDLEPAICGRLVTGCPATFGPQLITLAHQDRPPICQLTQW